VWVRFFLNIDSFKIYVFRFNRSTEAAHLLQSFSISMEGWRESENVENKYVISLLYTIMKIV